MYPGVTSVGSKMVHVNAGGFMSGLCENRS